MLSKKRINRIEVTLANLWDSSRSRHIPMPPLPGAHRTFFCLTFSSLLPFFGMGWPAFFEDERGDFRDWIKLARTRLARNVRRTASSPLCLVYLTISVLVPLFLRLCLSCFFFSWCGVMRRLLCRPPTEANAGVMLPQTTVLSGTAQAHISMSPRVRDLDRKHVDVHQR